MAAWKYQAAKSKTQAVVNDIAKTEKLDPAALDRCVKFVDSKPAQRLRPDRWQTAAAPDKDVGRARRRRADAEAGQGARSAQPKRQARQA